MQKSAAFTTLAVESPLSAIVLSANERQDSSRRKRVKSGIRSNRLSQEDTKRLYVEETYRILCEVGVEGVSARDLARAVGKTAPAVYHHFESMEYLIAVASVRFLMPYYEDLSALAQQVPHPLDLNLQGWECLSYYAFRNIPVFENLMFNNAQLGDRAIAEYYQLYPEEQIETRAYLAGALSLTDLEVRGRTLLQLAADEGYIQQADVDYLANFDILMFRGMFSKYRETYREPGVARAATSMFIELITRNYSRAVLPGHELMLGLLGRFWATKDSAETENARCE